MSRFDRHLPYDYEYTAGRSAWDSRTFIGVDNDDDDGSDDRYSHATLRRAPASVIGYGDLEFPPRTTSTRERNRNRDRDRDRERDRERERARDRERDKARARVRIRPRTGTLSGLSLTDCDKDPLKQRLCLDHHRSSDPLLPPNPGAAYPYRRQQQQQHHHHHPGREHHHPRARSLSLSRLAGGGGFSSTDSSLYEEDDAAAAAEVEAHRDEWGGVLPPAPGVPGSARESAGGTYYRPERVSLSNPRVPPAGAGGWPPLAGSRPGSRSRSNSLEREREREREYERGYRVLDGLSHAYLPEGDDDDLRVRLGGRAGGEVAESEGSIGSWAPEQEEE